MGTIATQLPERTRLKASWLKNPAMNEITKDPNTEKSIIKPLSALKILVVIPGPIETGI